MLDEWQKIKVDLLKSLEGRVSDISVEVLEKCGEGREQSTKRTFSIADLKWPYLFDCVIIIDLDGTLAVHIFE